MVRSMTLAAAAALLAAAAADPTGNPSSGTRS